MDRSAASQTQKAELESRLGMVSCRAAVQVPQPPLQMQAPSAGEWPSFAEEEAEEQAEQENPPVTSKQPLSSVEWESLPAAPKRAVSETSQGTPLTSR
jgi:hypothetical protein